MPLPLLLPLPQSPKGDLVTRCLARLLMWMARAFRASPAWLQWTVQWPVRKLTGIMRAALGRRMLVACEVAVEYYLSLLWSPQVSWLKEVDGAADLLVIGWFRFPWGWGGRGGYREKDRGKM